jgi:hypothetical protein
VIGRTLLGIVLLAALPGTGTAQVPAFAASSPATGGAPGNPADPEPALLLTAGGWRALAAGSGADRLCYVTPAAKTPNAPATPGQRAALIYVTHRPARQSFDVVTFVAAYSFRADSMARVSFGTGPSYRLFTDGGFAWAGDEANDRRIVRAMADAGTVTLTGLGTDGLLHEDAFALQGFAAAFQRASSECRRLGAPIRR